MAEVRSTYIGHAWSSLQSGEREDGMVNVRVSLAPLGEVTAETFLAATFPSKSTVFEFAKLFPVIVTLESTAPEEGVIELRIGTVVAEDAGGVEVGVSGVVCEVEIFEEIGKFELDTADECVEEAIVGV